MPWVWKGNNKGSGKGGGGGQGQGRSAPQAIPDDFQVDPSMSFVGTVDAYYKFSGYGFIVPDQKDVIPNDKVFVFWKSIKTEDRYPTLMKDMKVQFTVSVAEKQGVKTLQADNVTAP